MLIRVLNVIFILMLMNSCNGLPEKLHQRVGSPDPGMTGESQPKPRVIKRYAALTNAQKNAKTAARLRELRREVEENRRYEGLHPAASIAGIRRRYDKYSPVIAYQSLGDTTSNAPSNVTSSNHTDSITIPSVTMSESLDTYFRPIDHNVPQDHLIPFQEFGKKLLHRHRIKTTTINTNSLDNTTVRPKENNNSDAQSSNPEEEIHEEMDVTFSKPYTEQNKVTRPHHVMVISAASRRAAAANKTDEKPEATTGAAEVEEITTLKPERESPVDNVVVPQETPVGVSEGSDLSSSDSEPASSNGTHGEVFVPFLSEEEIRVLKLKGHHEGDGAEKLPKAYLKMREESHVVDDGDEATTTIKPKFNRTSTGFTLLHRTRGQINGAKKNMTAIRKLAKEKEDGNIENTITNSTANQKSEVTLETVVLEKNTTNATHVEVLKHKRGNGTHASFGMRRTPKLSHAEFDSFNKENNDSLVAEKVQVDITSTSTTERATTKNLEFENRTSKILSTAVVTSISVLDDWVPIIPVGYVENVTSYVDTNATPAVVHITPRYVERSRAQTKETVQVTYSKSSPSTTLKINTTRPISNFNQTAKRSAVIKMKNTASILNPLGVGASKLETSTHEAAIPNTTLRSIFVSTESSTTEQASSNTTVLPNVTQPNDLTKSEASVADFSTTTTIPLESVTVQAQVKEIIKRNVTELPRETVTSATTASPITTEKTTTTHYPITDAVPDEVKLNLRDGITTTAATTRPEEPVSIPAQPTTEFGYAKNHRNYETPSSTIGTVPILQNDTSTTNSTPKEETLTVFDEQINITTESTLDISETPEVEENPLPTTTRRPVRNATEGVGVQKKVPSNVRDRHRDRTVYRTDEDNVLRSRNKEVDGSNDTDVAVYVLGTFGIIPLAIAVMLAVRYLISRRKKIWESEKSPLTFVSTNEWEFPRSKLRLQTVLGQGNFGLVYKAEADDILGERATRLVAVKTIKDGATSQEKDDLMRELVILKQIGAHSNVVTLLGCCTEKEPYYLILEYVMYGKLLSFLRDNRTRRQYYNFSEETAELTPKDLTSFAYCVARGMEYLTSKGIIHRDLAARNILVDHNKICKVADFGMSRSVSEPNEIYEQAPVKGALPIRWMAPESLQYRVFTHKSDVWAFGILMWEIVTLGSTPYQSMCAREVIKQVRDGYRLERPNHCRAELYRVAATCWSHDPSKRPTFSEIKHELAELLEQGESQIYVDLESYIESISNSRTQYQTTQVVNL